MTGPQRDAATERQAEAADPSASTWVSANAGSGKTRVLTDRVARLLLDGAHPQRVLCLTYTKAAASEMQNRLFSRLGHWSMADDAELRQTLSVLGVGSAEAASTLSRARRLFARAIETPGGLKIQTIHSFCASILRRFPVEAGLSPGFREMDDAAADKLQRAVLSDLAERDPDVFADMAALVPDEDFAPLCAALQRHRQAFPAQPDWRATARRFELTGDETEAALCDAALQGIDPATCADMAEAIGGLSSTMDKLAAHLHAAARAPTPEARFHALSAGLLVADRSRVRANTPTAAARRALGPSAALLDAAAVSLLETVEQVRNLGAARATQVVHRFAAAFLPAYKAAKAERALLDFDDLIERTDELLRTPGVADWVLFRLDGGIEHVLVDEAQDTSPAQWRVIDLLTREFTAGEGRRDPGARTLFVVGDVKQSIYSFQGADPDNFLRMQDGFAARLDQIGVGLIPLELEYSFRSAPEILRTVDETFPPDNRDGLGETVLHRAFKADLPGRVELWPIIERQDGTADGAWYDPVDRTNPEHHHALLAAKVAQAARTMVQTGQLTASDGTPRRVTAGDILILVQSRGTIFHEVIRACKSVGLDVAGADVLKLAEELAVKDITALLAFLDLPEDSLSLATVLRSPLCGWTEAELYDLAQGRAERHLWASLRARAAEFPETHGMLSDLRDASEYLRPYELIERILTNHDGRRRLVARLGHEATDGIDALLSSALAHERTEVPSLTAFLAAQQARMTQIKRQAEGRGSKLRVMTVHGAKGLEAPIVILPDTAEQRRTGQFTEKLLSDEDGTPLWSVRRDEAPDKLARLRDAAIARRRAEARRLLYVAMTRAEQWLVVAAAGALGSDPSLSWYGQVEAGLNRAGASLTETGGLILQSADWPAARASGPEPRAVDRADPLPGWATVPVPPPDRPPRTLAPSELGGEKALPGEGGLSQAAAKARGTRVHLLLEHLAAAPPAARAPLAQRLFAPEACPPDELQEALRVLDAPALAHLFGPGAIAEAAITAALPELGGVRLHGSVDRLILSQECVLAVDFKTNATRPDTPETVPEGILRQMGAYRAALSQTFPDRRVETAILWTRDATLMPLPDHLLQAALARAHEEVTGSDA
ncbi:MAG: double-strand break repair helicase AddA [Pseudomonadota bacterium]